MRRLRLTPARYYSLCVGALVALVAIIVTGGAVRLTGSGLGCSDWPTCENDRLVAPLQYHAMIEFVNRLITGLVSLAVIAAVLGALVRVPRRRDLVWLALGLVVGVLGQILLGAALVLAHLDPRFTIGHFLLSIALVTDAVVLCHRARADGGASGAVARPPAALAARRLAAAALALGALATVTGTVVTGSGPHGGDDRAARLGFAVSDVARIHSLCVWAFVATIVALALVLARREGSGPRLDAVRTLVILAVAQGAIGYTQYFTGVPPVLVGIHLLGASLVWAATVQLGLLVLGTGPAAPPVDPGEQRLPSVPVLSRG